MNGLITTTGKTIDCKGSIHKNVCEAQLGISLGTFLAKKGGLRIMSGRNNTLAIEFYGELSKEQIRCINAILRDGVYYTIITAQKTIKKFRPIKRFIVN